MLVHDKSNQIYLVIMQGHIAVQWAKSKGCKVIGLCSTESKCEFLRSIGCDRVINYKVDDLDRILDDEYPVVFMHVFNQIISFFFNVYKLIGWTRCHMGNDRW